jgi:tyrosinase
MRFSLTASALVGAVSTVSGLALPDMAQDVKGITDDLNHKVNGIIRELAPALKLFDTPPVHVVSLADFKTMDRNGTKLAPHGHAVSKDDPSVNSAPSEESLMKKPMMSQKFATPAAAASCAANPNVRFEWRDFSNSDRNALTDGIKCLLNKPASGNFPPARNRYEDFVRVHQQYSPNIHNNAKFLLWHRYFLWTFEQVLREECGFNRAFTWWDETKDAGQFAKSTIFTPEFFGSLPGPTNGAGTCIRDGAFKDITLHIGPGSGQSDHCLSRAVDETATAQCSKDFENYCMSRSSYPDFESCWEFGPHGYGHNGIGSVMADVMGSVGDPAFWMHHTYIDRVYRVWQNADVSRRTTISGKNADGSPLTLDTGIYVGGIRPDVKVRDVLDTLNGVMCYRYNY